MVEHVHGSRRAMGAGVTHVLLVRNINVLATAAAMTGNVFESEKEKSAHVDLDCCAVRRAVLQLGILVRR